MGPTRFRDRDTRRPSAGTRRTNRTASLTAANVHPRDQAVFIRGPGCESTGICGFREMIRRRPLAVSQSCKRVAIDPGADALDPYRGFPLRVAARYLDMESPISRATCSFVIPVKAAKPRSMASPARYHISLLKSIYRFSAFRFANSLPAKPQIVLREASCGSTSNGFFMTIFLSV
jgi:hypothetical protein